MKLSDNNGDTSELPSDSDNDWSIEDFEKELDEGLKRRKAEGEIFEPNVGQILFDLDGIGRFMDLLDSEMDELLDKERIRIDAECEPGGAEAEEEHHVADTDYLDLFPNILTYSYVTWLATTLESSLVKLCQFVRFKKRLAFKVNDFHGSVIEQIELFLRQVDEQPLPTDGSWVWIKDVFAIRHCIVHEAGKVRAEKYKKVRSIAERRVGLALSEDANFDTYLIVKLAFCKEALSAVRTVLKAVHSPYCSWDY